MIVEVKGIGLPNKGAELMLVAILQELSRKYQDLKFVVDPNTDYLGRCRYGLYQKAWMNIKGIQLGYLANLLPQKILGRFGIIKDKNIDFILDASGFCYSDSFGYENAYEQVGRYIKKWCKSGKKYIFLPQAYGPFENPKLANLMRNTLSQASLFFPRDNVSKQYLDNLLSADVACAPDFTCLVKGVVPDSFNSDEAGNVCIILNSRMIEKHCKEDGELYLSNTLLMINYIIHELGGKPYFLMHEGQDDIALTDKINAELDSPLSTYYFEDPLHIKGVIGTAKLVISSRFHGLVSALTQGIPVLATGWSHKYKMLLEDYACSALLMNHLDINEINEKVAFIFNEENYSNIKASILLAKDRQVKSTENMWEQVHSVIAEKSQCLKS